MKKNAASIATLVALAGSIAAVSSCSTLAGQSDMAVYKSLSGQEIKLSKHELIINGKTYRGTDCSTSNFRCVVYGDFVVLSVPKACAGLVKDGWDAAGARFHLSSIMPEGGIVVQTSSNDDLQYTVNVKAGSGIANLVYDSTGDAHMANRSRYLEGNTYDERMDMIYFKQSGPAILPCE